MLKRLFVLILIAVSAVNLLCAQNKNDKKDKGFRFVYIAHDTETPISRLSERLRDMRRDALDGYEDIVFYLASGSNPVVVEFNIGENNQSAFDELLLSELNERNSHEIEPEYDKSKILELLDKYNVIDSTKKLNYDSVKFNFFVGSNFWSLRNNEFLIAPIFFSYDVPHITGGRVQFLLLEPQEDRLPDGPLFGDKNVENINEIIEKTTY